jgi:hypothetical protein
LKVGVESHLNFFNSKLLNYLLLRRSIIHQIIKQEKGKTMKKIIFAGALALTTLAATTADAQSFRGSINTPGFSMSVGSRPQYGYNSGYSRGYANNPIMDQRMRVQRVKRMAYADGFVSRYERRMISNEENRLAYLMGSMRGGYGGYGRW